MSVPESTSHSAPPKPAEGARPRDACRSHHLTDILAQPAIPGRKAGRPAEAESSGPTVRGADAPTPRSSATLTSDERRLISSAWDPLPWGQLFLDQLFSTRLQLPRATPIMMVLSTRLQALAGSFGILLLPAQMASSGSVWELTHYLFQTFIAIKDRLLTYNAI